jgi:hypothetical protein
VLDPNTTECAGTVCKVVESQFTYVAKRLRKVSSQEIRSSAPSVATTCTFSSSYKVGFKGGKFHGLVHVICVKSEPRGEDFEHTYRNPQG